MAQAADKSTTTETKPPKLTRKEIIFLKGLAEGKTKVQAAMDAYPDQNYQTAAVTANENLKKPKLQEALADAYEKVGINAQSIADVLRDGMLAKKTATMGGEIIESNLPDHSVRINAAKTAATLVGAGDKDAPPAINFNFGTQNYVRNAEVKP